MSLGFESISKPCISILCCQHVLSPLTSMVLQEGGCNHQLIWNVIGAQGQRGGGTRAGELDVR